MKQRFVCIGRFGMVATWIVCLPMLVGCDAPIADGSGTDGAVAVESAPQPPANPFDALDAESVAEDERQESIDVDASIDSFKKNVEGQRNTSLPLAPKQRPQGERSPGTSTTTSPSATQRVDHVKLSAGVALPQSLPTGTAIGLSIDYEVVRALPGSAKQVFWVIEAGGNQKVEFPVQLEQSRGNLMTFARDLKPRHAPFRCHMQILLQDGTRQVISPSVPMRY